MRDDAKFMQAHMVCFERPLAVAPQHLWQLLTEIRHLPGWYGEGGIDARVGGAVALMGGHIRGTVTHCTPPQRLTYSWNVFNPGDDVSPYPESYVSFELAPRDGLTVLTLTHLPVLEQFVKLNAMGWHTFLDMVEAAVRGETVEARDVYMKRNAAHYGIDLGRMPA